MPQEHPSGYLSEDYRFFHLKDSRAQSFDYHYHDFDKVIFFLSGSVTYMVEGRAYFLQPGDALLIPHNHIHYPIIDSSKPYERVILWATPDFLSHYGLNECFVQADSDRFHLLRTEQHIRGEWMHLIQSLESSQASKGFGHELLDRTYCLQLLISLNRAAMGSRATPSEQLWRIDPKIESVMNYINANLNQDLSVQALSRQFYLSQSYLMHRFKDVTGCTIHQYVLQKRLIRSAELIRRGVPIMKAAARSGFQDYSAFLRAFQKTYHLSPKDLRTTSGSALQEPPP